MVTILKNMTNILTAIGEIYIFRKGQNKKVWAALFLMVCPRSIPVWNAFTLIDDFSLHPELIFLFFLFFAGCISCMWWDYRSLFPFNWLHVADYKLLSNSRLFG
jgi:hypothetical protein